MDRDFTARPYTANEKRVCDYLLHITHDQIGCGDDPIGFLIASHNAINEDRKRMRKALKMAMPIVGAAVAKSPNESRPLRQKVYQLIVEALR